MKLRLSLISGLVVAIAACGNTNSVTPPSALDQIRASGEVRCGYIVYSNYITKDPVSGELGGVYFDLLEQIGSNADLEVNWVEEVGYENIFTALESGRIDAFCGGLWPNASRALAGSFSEPAFYSTIPAWTRFGNNTLNTVEDIASTGAKIAVIDGAMEDLIARSDFADNERVSIPQLSPFGLNFENIVTRKADVTFAEASVAVAYMASNPNTLQVVEDGRSLRTFGNSIVVRKGDFETREFFDFAVLEMINSGQVQRIVEQYDPDGAVFKVPVQNYTK